MTLQHSEVLTQSKRAYSAWAPIWRHNSNVVKTQIKNKLPMQMFREQGLGKSVVVVSMGPSLESQIETIKKHQNKVDIACVDKAYGALCERGIIPDICLVADAQVSFEIYCEPYLKYSEKTLLLANVNSNPKWGLNWRGAKTYYVNKDNIESEKEFSSISGVNDLIPAGSNVSNALFIYLSNVIKYDHYYLVGYDFCWDVEGKFYAFAHGNEKSGIKSVNLNQMRVMNQQMKLVNCSENLWFSARWLESWIVKVVGVYNISNCSKGIMAYEEKDLSKLLAELKQYKREFTYDELVKTTKRTLTINSPQAYAEAKKLLNDDNINIIDGQIIFQTPEDKMYACPQTSKDVPLQVELQQKAVQNGSN